MPIRRTFSVRRFRVEGRLPGLESEEFRHRLTERRFRPLSPSEEHTHGWVRADNLLLTDFDQGLVVGSRAVFALRRDRRRVDARVLRARLDLEIRGRLGAAQDEGGGSRARAARVGREERQRLRADLHAAALRETSPTVAVHPVVLDPRGKVLHALTLSGPASELLCRLFRATFTADLLPLTPWRRGQEILAGSEALARLDTLDRADLRPGTGSPSVRVLEEVR